MKNLKQIIETKLYESASEDEEYLSKWEILKSTIENNELPISKELILETTGFLREFFLKEFTALLEEYLKESDRNKKIELNAMIAKVVPTKKQIDAAYAEGALATLGEI